MRLASREGGGQYRISLTSIFMVILIMMMKQVDSLDRVDGLKTMHEGLTGYVSVIGIVFRN